MDAQARQGMTGTVRATAVMLALLSVLVVAAVAAPPADAHQRAGRTIISVDGEVVKNTRDDHFTYRKTLSPGCHDVKVVQRRGGNVYAVYQQRECTRGQSVLVVKVDHSNVSIGTTPKSVANRGTMTG